ncbi:MAG: Lrp/AsnC family transcriptional regulator [Chitinivorax sp.]
MTDLDLALLNNYQRAFPLCSRPYAELAQQLQISEGEVLQRLLQLKQAGSISRIGPVFRPNSIGVSTLAALAVPSAQLEQVAALVNAYPQVNHNYQREHDYNLWFVATADEPARLASTLEQIRSETGCPLLDLPLVKDYYIDLGFDLGGGKVAQRQPQAHVSIRPNAAQRSLIGILQGGLPMVSEPYREIAERLGTSEVTILEQISDWQKAGIIKRFGVVVRHHELGYTANAMVVWDIPDHQVEAVGQQLAKDQAVSLCYQRPRRLPDWHYNLFCMIHGKDRATVEAHIEQLARQHDLQSIPRQSLFSLKRFKQRGAHYVLEKAA